MPDYVRGEKPYSRQGLLNSVEHSLKLLNTKTIDVLLIHDPYKNELEQALAPGGLMEGMRELKQQGASAKCHAAQIRRALSLSALVGLHRDRQASRNGCTGERAH
eukprot:COSAG02_NODE_8488_length_2552_cov_4.203832_2_plen_105_part_00